MKDNLNKEIGNYLKYKYNIPPLNNNEKVDIENSKSNLLKLSKEKLKNIQDSFSYTISGILETANKHSNETRLSDFYLGSIHRDLYFCISHNGVCISPYIQKDDKSKISIEFLNREIETLKNKINTAENVVELIESLEEMKEQITVANTVYKL